MANEMKDKIVEAGKKHAGKTLYGIPEVIIYMTNILLNGNVDHDTNLNTATNFVGWKVK